MLSSIKEIDQKRLSLGISKYRLCKDSQVNGSHYYTLLKKDNPTRTTLIKLNKSLIRLSKLNGRNNGHKQK